MDADEDRRRQAVDTLCARLQLELTEHLEVALTHPSFANEQPGTPHNQRLEFLGDAVLGLCVSELLMDAFEDVDEGQLTVMRAALVNTRALAEVARSLTLASALRLGRGADNAGERKRTNVLADAVEAVVAAAYLDGGLQKARALTKLLLQDRLDELVAHGGVQRDAKSRLQELMQGRGWAPPSYEVVAMDGPPHLREFTVQVTVQLQDDEAQVLQAQSSGRSKKIAAQGAAAALLKTLSQSDAEPQQDDASGD